MKYFKNTELAKIYNVSEKTVRNWIVAAQEGKLDLQLFEDRDKVWIANTSKNTRLIEEQVQKGKKYRNTRGMKRLTPKDIFYKLYTPKQILDIISSLTVHHETPLQYTYIDGGAEDWDKYAERLIREEAPNMLKRSIELLGLANSGIEQLIHGYKKVNIIDLGPGNGLPIRPTLEYFQKSGRLNRYVPVDISQDMLTILEKNIRNWFGNSIKYEPHIRDISYERFNDFSANEFTDDETINIVFLLGGTLANFRSPNQVLQVIGNSLGINDIFIYSGYLDNPRTRRYFDYYNTDRKVPVQDGIILDFLGIDESLYDVEQMFDETKRARSISIKPKVDISIEFKLSNTKRSVELRKDVPILLWRHRHYSAVEMINLLDQNDFDIMQAIKSEDQDHILLISKIKTYDSAK